MLNIVPEGTSEKEIDKIKKASGSLISKTKCNSELVLIESSDPLETITEQSANYDLLILGTQKKIIGLMSCLEEEETSLFKTLFALF